MKARYLLLAMLSALGVQRQSYGGPWSTEPVLGVIAQYSSNPELLGGDAGRAETRAALRLDLPIEYDSDQWQLLVAPRIRYSGESGYSTLTANYYHLDTSLIYSHDRGSVSFVGSAYEDSSLLYAAELANGLGVRRSTLKADLGVKQSLTERLQFQMDGSTSRTTYGAGGGGNLVDYRYSTAVPGISYTLAERDVVQLTGVYGHYNSLDERSSSNTTQLQLGMDHLLSELWTLSMSAGYSKSQNRISVYFFNFFLGEVEGSQRSAVYSLGLTRLGEQSKLTFNASRAQVPTGFAFLSRQDSVSALFNYRVSERWAFNADVVWSRVDDPQFNGGLVRHDFYNGGISCEWHATERWTTTLRASRIGQHFRQSLQNADSNGVSLELSRQFLRKGLE